MAVASKRATGWVVASKASIKSARLAATLGLCLSKIACSRPVLLPKWYCTALRLFWLASRVMVLTDTASKPCSANKSSAVRISASRVRTLRLSFMVLTFMVLPLCFVGLNYSKLLVILTKNRTI